MTSFFKKYGIALVLTTVCCSCGGFLDEDPKGFLKEEQAYATRDALFRNAVLTLYSHIGGYNDSEGLQGTGRGIYDLNTFTTDEAIMPTRGGDWYDGGFWQGLFLLRWGVSNEAIQNSWEYLYGSILLCNKSLEEIRSFQERYPASNIIALEAEYRALRALFYYYAMDFFCLIPFLMTSNN